MSESNPFEVGDVVKMRGLTIVPHMTVSDVEDHIVACLWFDKNDRLQSANFRAGVLEYAAES